MNRPEVVVRDIETRLFSDVSPLDPIFQRILLARGVTSTAQIDYQLANMLSLDVIRNLPEAAQLVARCITQQQQILIFGDYDADGATSTALCVKALKLMGA